MKTGSHLHGFADFREQARRSLPVRVFDFIDGGAGDEAGMARNRMSYRDRTLTPRVGVDVRDVSLACAFPWGRAAAPFGIAPVGLTGLIHPQADRMLATAAARANIPYIVSACANTSIEDIAHASGRAPWFQFYMPSSGRWEPLIRRVQEAGCPTLVLTLDAAAPGRRLRDLRNGLSLPLRTGLRDLLRNPRWLHDQKRGPPLGFPNLPGAESLSRGTSFSELMASQTGGAMSWADIARIRAAWPNTLMVKGVMDVRDAEQALALGVDAIVVSNHGGRQLDCSPAPLHAVEGMVQAGVRPEALLVDSGVRSGEDIVKALHAGAGMVLLGRAFLFALAAEGPQGVERLIQQLLAETRTCMRLVGTARIEDIHKTLGS
ncbi:alpha-hydroxy-acid oxidizing protein [Xanthomonas euroxanthea]|uniref:Alpha-hydroxy-acid oxidizing protein n=1 Tax=Xanthomonas euroxanthea TaxID=2259622 RepID=A0A8E4G687_9XANT|nr:alpha-hydroxy acid oxidase [Xanthomonas euroxanthea]CAD1792184.1 alpha-hydroxy-acid oxidizing protein [Xanthomonas euroxanthea]SYZ55753.1 alpha-hydroxy-acid oxidizing protein [Xanthomonas arboricola pv. juglandis]